MKKINILIAFCIISHIVGAQTTKGNSSDIGITNEVGVNASLFFRQFLNAANSGNLPDNPYLVTYKRHFKGFILRGWWCQHQFSD